MVCVLKVCVRARACGRVCMLTHTFKASWEHTNARTHACTHARGGREGERTRTPTRTRTRTQTHALHVPTPHTCLHELGGGLEGAEHQGGTAQEHVSGRCRRRLLRRCRRRLALRARGIGREHCKLVRLVIEAAAAVVEVPLGVRIGARRVVVPAVAALPGKVIRDEGGRVELGLGVGLVIQAAVRVVEVPLGIRVGARRVRIPAADRQRAPTPHACSVPTDIFRTRSSRAARQSRARGGWRASWCAPMWRPQHRRTSRPMRTRRPATHTCIAW